MPFPQHIHTLWLLDARPKFWTAAHLQNTSMYGNLTNCSELRFPVFDEEEDVEIDQ